MSSSTILIWSHKFLTSATLCEELSPCQIWENCRLPLISMGNLVIFVVGLLDNWLVKVTETFTDILNYYVLQTTADKFAVHEKMYVVKKYLNAFNPHHLAISKFAKWVSVFTGDQDIHPDLFFKSGQMSLKVHKWSCVGENNWCKNGFPVVSLAFSEMLSLHIKYSYVITFSSKGQEVDYTVTDVPR